MNTRVAELRKELNLTLEKFGKRVGVTKVAISNIEKGNRKLTEQMLLAICKEFDVNEDWLRNGEGEMFNSVPNSAMEQIKKEYHLDDFSFNLVYEYLKLTDEKRRVVRELFHNALAAEQAALGPITEEQTGQYAMVLDETENTTEITSKDDDEELYKKNILDGASKTDVIVSNTIEDIESSKNVANK